MQEVEDPLQGFEESRMSQGLSHKSRSSGSVQFVDLTPMTYSVDDALRDGTLSLRGLAKCISLRDGLQKQCAADWPRAGRGRMQRRSASHLLLPTVSQA